MRSRNAVVFGIIVAVLAVSPWFVKAQKVQTPESFGYFERTAVCAECAAQARTYARLREQFDAFLTLANSGAAKADKAATEKGLALERQLDDAEAALDACNKACVDKRARQHVPARCQECETLAQDYEAALGVWQTTSFAATNKLDKQEEEKAAIAAAEAKAAAALKALEACEKEKCKKPLGIGYGMAGAIAAGGAAIATGVAIGGGDNPPSTTPTATTPTTTTNTVPVATTPTPSPTPAPTPAPTTPSTAPPTTPTTAPPSNPSPSSFNGVWLGGGGVGTNECSFSATATVQGTINVDDSGRGTWTKIHTNAGVTFIFQIVLQVTGATTAEWTSTAIQNIGTNAFVVTDNGSIAGRVMTVKQTFVRQGTPCTVVYNLTLNKQ